MAWRARSAAALGRATTRLRPYWPASPARPRSPCVVDERSPALPPSRRVASWRVEMSGDWLDWAVRSRPPMRASQRRAARRLKEQGAGTETERSDRNAARGSLVFRGDRSKGRASEALAGLLPGGKPAMARMAGAGAPGRPQTGAFRHGRRTGVRRHEVNGLGVKMTGRHESPCRVPDGRCGRPPATIWNRFGSTRTTWRCCGRCWMAM